MGKERARGGSREGNPPSDQADTAHTRKTERGSGTEGPEAKEGARDRDSEEPKKPEGTRAAKNRGGVEEECQSRGGVDRGPAVQVTQLAARKMRSSGENWVPHRGMVRDQGNSAQAS